ncbi:MAG: glycosyltransferase family 39 protein [Polyangiaceae bacterium]
MSAEPDAPREDASAPERDTPPVESRAESVSVRVAVGIAIAVSILSAALVLTFDYGRDQAIYALVAREMLHGKLPYRDAFDFKPPGIFFVYAVSRGIFGASQTGIRVLEVVSMALTAFGLVRLSELHTGRRTAGFIAAGLASQVHAQLDFWHTAQPETFGGALTVWGLVAATRAWSAIAGATETPAKILRKSALLWVASGVLFGASGLMKPPLAGAGAVVALVASSTALLRDVLAKRKLGLRAAVPLAGMGVGGVLPVALTLAWFKAKGGLGDLHEVLFVFTPYYTKISWENASVLPMAWYGLSEWLVTYSSALLTGLVALALLRPDRRAWGAAATLLGCIFVHIAGIVMQGKFFPYHWGATFPLTALLAGLGLERALRVSATKLSWFGAIACGALFAILAAARCPVPSYGETFLDRSKLRLELVRHPPPDKQLKWDGLATVADVDAAQNRAVAMWLRDNTPKNEPVFVWGFECVIYDLAERELSSRYIYNVPQRAVWSAKPMQASLMAELAKKPPSTIVVERGDVFGMVTGNNDDSARALWNFHELRDLIFDQYDYRLSIGDFDIYTRRTETERDDLDFEEYGPEDERGQ